MGTLKNELSSLFAKMGDDAPNMRKQRRIAEVYERYKGALESVYGDGAQLFLSHTNAVYILRDDGTRRAGAKNGAAAAPPFDMRGGARPSATRGTWQPRRNAHGGGAGTSVHAIDGAAETAEHLSGGAAAMGSGPVADRSSSAHRAPAASGAPSRSAAPQLQKRLVVYVDDSIYAAELNAQRELLRLKLLELFGERIDVFDIFISRGNYRKKHPFDRMRAESAPEPVRKTPPAPLSAEEESRVDEAAARVENPRVQRALEKAMKADLEWKKGEKGKK